MWSKKKILVVEDEAELSEIIKLSLEKENFDVSIAKSVSAALKFFEDAVLPDLVWLDHRLLGKENGLDFVRDLRQRGNPVAQTPIVVVATIITEEDVRAYASLGVKDYYLKSEHRLGKIISDIKKYLK